MGWIASVSRWLDGRDRLSPPPLDLGDWTRLPPGIPEPAPEQAVRQHSAVTPSSIRRRVAGAFDAAHPVRKRDELFGRDEQLDQLISAVLDFNKHAVIHGARGSGKTSLARVLGEHADDAGAVVLYHACEPQANFAALMRPYLASIPPAALAPNERREFVEAFNGTQPDFGPRTFVDLVAGRIIVPTILIFDEFDRVENQNVQADIAAAMKLLSDTLTPMLFVLVGIARTVSDVIAGHPSLRRHMRIVPLGRITPADVAALINKGEAEAGVKFDEAARAAIADAACGSPFHLRLFAGKAALAALADGKDVVARRHVHIGFVDAFKEWSSTNEADARLFAAALLHGSPSDQRMMETFARAVAVDDAVVLDPMSAPAIRLIEPALERDMTSDPALLRFLDSTAPQMFLALLLSAPHRHSDIQKESIVADPR